MKPGRTQVVIYLNDPKGQLIQTTMRAFRRKWQARGWTVLRNAPRLPLGISKQRGTVI